MGGAFWPTGHALSCRAPGYHAAWERWYTLWPTDHGLLHGLLHVLLHGLLLWHPLRLPHRISHNSSMSTMHPIVYDGCGETSSVNTVSNGIRYTKHIYDRSRRNTLGNRNPLIFISIFIFYKNKKAMEIEILWTKDGVPGSRRSPARAGWARERIRKAEVNSIPTHY